MHASFSTPARQRRESIAGLGSTCLRPSRPSLKYLPFCRQGVGMSGTGCVCEYPLRRRLLCLSPESCRRGK
eukprot:765944-Pyramimonas_sp.AAC.1